MTVALVCICVLRVYEWIRGHTPAFVSTGEPRCRTKRKCNFVGKTRAEKRMKREERVCCRETQRVGGGIVEGCISLERNLRAHRSLLYNNRGSSIFALYISVLQFLFFLLSWLMVHATTKTCPR